MAEHLDEAMEPRSERPLRRNEREGLAGFLHGNLGNVSNPGTPPEFPDEDSKGRSGKGKIKGPLGPKGKGAGRIARERVQNSISEVPLGFSEARQRARGIKPHRTSLIRQFRAATGPFVK